MAVAITVALAAATTSTTIAQDQPSPGCEAGWTSTLRLDGVAIEDVAVVSAADAWAVGGTSLGGGKRGAAIVRFDGTEWTSQDAPASSARDSGFLSLDTNTAGDVGWAVGYEREPEFIKPFIGRLKDGKWTSGPNLDIGARGGSLIDVAIADDGDVWAVGHLFGRAGVQDPLVIRRSDGDWKDVSPSIASGKRATLATIAIDATSDAWVGGTIFEAGVAAPYLARRSAGEWERQGVPDQGDGSISGLAIASGTDGWAVGHRYVGASIVGLMWHWDGTDWIEWASPKTGSAATILTGIATDADALPVVSGTMWDEAAHRFRGFTARWDGATWLMTEAAKKLSPSWIKSIDGDPRADGWLAGLAGSATGDSTLLADGILARICEEEAVIGGTPPRSGPAEGLSEATDAESVNAPPVAGPGTAKIDVRDVAADAGLPALSTTWGAVVADFDQDGRDDIFLSRHGKRAKLYLHSDAGYVDSDVRFKGGDRHGCAAADVDGSGLPDLYCTFGALRGLGIKANQLWLDPAGPEPLLHPTVGGAIEPFGRGRFPLFIDIDDDGHRDLLIGQEPNRPDGLVSVNRAYVRTGPAAFEPVPLPTFDEGLNPESMATGDVDGDGREDVLIVHRDPRASEPRSGVRLYLNHGNRTFEDASSAYGLDSARGIDAALVALDDGASLDLVLVTGDRVRVLLNSGGSFEQTFERRTSAAVAVAAGDADGDGDQDLYVLRDKSKGGGGDMILLNGGDGRSFEELTAPAVSGGTADDVFAIDYDQDGTTEFLALNGRGGEDGPVQLISVAR